MALETELAYFESRKEELARAYMGQFVLIRGNDFLGAFTTQAEAYAEGLKRVGNQPFLIKRVGDEPAVNFFALDFGLLRAHP